LLQRYGRYILVGPDKLARAEFPVVVMGIAFVLMAIAFLIVRRNRAGKKAGNRKDGEA
jgi:hypothetical protein